MEKLNELEHELYLKIFHTLENWLPNQSWGYNEAAYEIIELLQNNKLTRE
jgi:hypothetical protein